MAKYRITRLSFIGKQLHEEGAEIDYDGIPGSALEPLDDDAKAAKEKALSAKGITPGNLSDALVESLTTLAEAGDTSELDTLRLQYKELFNKTAHHQAKAETLRNAIAEERKKLGV
jgi:hypothetical protein